jgi:carbon monoxide dehydrogenase subunit G
MELNSNKVIVAATKAEIISYLSNAENIWDLLPQDKVSDFKATTEQCSIKVQGGITISLIENGATENELYLKSGDKSPFPFKLTIKLSEAEGGTEGFIHFDGEVNMFLKMMVEKPLTALFNYMSEKLKVKFG